MMRKLLIGVGVVLIAVVAGGIYLYTQLDFLVQRAIESYGSDMLQAKVEVKQLKLSLTEGRGEIGEFTVGNPKGFKSKQAVSVGGIDLAIDPATVGEDVVLVKKILVDKPQLTYEQGSGGSNFDALQRNVNSYIGESKPKAKEEPGKETKLIVEDLLIRGARVEYIPAIPTPGMDLSFTLPDIHLRNLGKSKGGITSAELTQAIIDAILSRTTAAIAKSVTSAPKALENLFGR